MKNEMIDNSPTKHDVYQLLQGHKFGLTVEQICEKLQQFDDSQIQRILRVNKKIFIAPDGIHWKPRDSFSADEETKIIFDSLYQCLKNLPSGHSFKRLVSIFPSYGKIQIKQVLKSNPNIFVSCGDRWGIKGVFNYRDELGEVVHSQEEKRLHKIKTLFNAMASCKYSEELQNRIMSLSEAKILILSERWKKIRTAPYFPPATQINLDNWVDILLADDESFNLFYKRAIGQSFHLQPNSILGSDWIKIMLLNDNKWNQWKQLLQSGYFPKPDKDNIEALIQIALLDSTKFEVIFLQAKSLFTLINHSSLFFDDWEKIISLAPAKWKQFEDNLVSLDPQKHFPNFVLKSMPSDSYKYIVESLYLSSAAFGRKKAKILRIIKEEIDRRSRYNFTSDYYKIKPVSKTPPKKMPPSGQCMGNCSTCKRDPCPWDNND